MDFKSAKAHLDLELRRAKRAAAIERAAPLALPAAIAGALWAALGLSGGLGLPHPLIASLGVIAALAGIGWLAARGWRGYRPPSAADARARLERDAQLEIGSLSTAEDRPSRLDADSLALWGREQERARARIAEARASRPSPKLNSADPLRLRYLAVAALIAGLVAAGVNAPDRLVQAFVPDPGPLLGDGPLQIEAWATPDAYTGAGPIPLSDPSGRAPLGQIVALPPKSEATVRVSGAVGAPKLVFEGQGVRREARFVRTDDGAWEARLPIDRAGALSVVRFQTKARWRLAPTADQAPVVAFVGAPALEGRRLTFTWEARDDYGLRGLFLEMVPREPPEGLVGAAPHRLALEAPPGDPRSARGEAEIEMAAHPYAGLAVSARLIAVDAAGGEGAGESAALDLPPPSFLQPLALAAIEIRRAILWERRPYSVQRRPWFGRDEARPPLHRAPPGLRRAASLLDGLMIAPQDGYFPDLAVFAGFAVARASLDHAADFAAADLAADFLWHTAMRAEFGASADARKGLEQAQKALAEAIQRGAPPEEIAQLSQAVREAMRRYLDALVAEAMREGRVAESQEDREEQAQLGQQDLENLLNEVQRLAENGQMDQALALLQQIAGLLDGLEVRLVDGEGSGGEQGRDPELEQAIQGLSGAMGEQRSLRDETEDAARGEASPGEGREPGGEAASLARRQRDLADGLREARDGIEGSEANNGGEEGRTAAAAAGEALDEAERAMREAGRALQREDFETARRAQDEALSALRGGADTLAQEQLRRERGESAGRRGGQGGQRDPLGREVRGGVGDGDDVGVPDRIDGERAREIRDELRRRAQDPRRPQAERDYLRRLLERFEGA